MSFWNFITLFKMCWKWIQCLIQSELSPASKWGKLMLRLYWGQVPLRAPKVCSFVPKKKARLRNEDTVELISKREDLTISLSYKTLWGQYWCPLGDHTKTRWSSDIILASIHPFIQITKKPELFPGFGHLVAKYATNVSGAIWWPN